MKGIPSFLLLTAAFFVVMGCDTGRDQAITGDFFDRKAGEYTQSSARIDSVNNYPYTFNEVAYALAGNYGNTSAFAVFKFSRPSSSILANLESARLKFTVYGIWADGDREFALYQTGVDWSDSTSLDPDIYLSGLGSPLAVNADTTTSLTTLLFTLNEEGLEYIKSWGSAGAFLLKSTDQGKAMATVYTNYSSSSPVLELVSSGTDTTRSKPVESVYAFDSGLSSLSGSKKRGVVSDGAATGFVLYISLPDSSTRTDAINSGTLVLPIERNDIPDGESLYLGFYVLTKEFTDIDNVQIASEYQTSFTLDSADTQIELNISEILGAWTTDPESNLGLLFKPSTVSSSPSQVIFSLPDSIGISFTTIPEVE